ncbi:MAG: fumarylacetoacetate hydrolase family protein [Planctomycetes bacterium]|nr:fumarylacetoacetate hydrolase family protein [Planctomycetota bacterium]
MDDRSNEPAGPAWFAYRHGGTRLLGVVDPESGTMRSIGAHDELERLASGGLSLEALRLLARVGEPLDPGSIVWDVPVERPSKILGLGRNFVAHAKELGNEVPEEPLFFGKLADTLLPHEGTIRLPHWVQSRIDHEIELCVVLGFDDPDRHGRRYVSRDDAMELVAGYTILNDVTARTIQIDDRNAKKPWLRSKSFDTFCPVGPWVVPRDALDPHALAIDCYVGAEHRQSSNTELMIVDVPGAIEWLSRHTTLRPGDLIAMGTPDGVGPLADGDACVGRIAGIGTLRNRVTREPAPGHGR